MMTPDEARAALESGVLALTSSEAWARALAVAARFHRYSFGNAVLIALQRPDATRVAGYVRWKELGRQVRKGEHGIAILAPIVTRVREPEATESPEDPAPAHVAPSRAVRFRVAYVFDEQQTDGPALPAASDFATRLRGGSDRERDLYERLADALRADRWTVSRAPIAIDSRNGQTDFASRAIVVRDDLAPAQALKTLAHEAAHAQLHNGMTGMACRDAAEVEAESAAYIALAALGIDSGAYSFGYVAAWSAGKPADVQRAGANAMTAARWVLAAVGEGEPAEH